MIRHLRLTDFTCFGDVSLEFCRGLNVFMGANSTGKTHLLKLLAAILKAQESLVNGQLPSRERFENTIGEKLSGYFRPKQLGRLVRRSPGKSRAEIGLTMEEETLRFTFSNNSKNSVKIQEFTGLPNTTSLYMPPREMLSLYEGFQSLYEKREVAFDETYYQLAKALSAPLLRGAQLSDIRDLVEPLERETRIRVFKEDEQFFVQESIGKIEAYLVADGMRKIASIIYLLTNGELSKNSILFWDEPEANLNPKLIKLVAKLLRQFAANGMQVFVATHDFLLVHYLSLFDEYSGVADALDPELRFFSLQKDENAGTQVETGANIADINHNLILDEFAAYHDLEQGLFNQTISAHGI